MSFTVLAALARDNGFRLIIVLSGMTRELADQSRDRLLRDLNVRARPFPPWLHFHNPRLQDLEHVRNALMAWRDPAVQPEHRRTVLITVLKNHANLRRVTEMLQRLGEDTRVPSLVIDDEADQASLNNLVRKGRFSTTYRRIGELRNALPHHSYLQYTATPQAPLLIRIVDTLSPESAVLLDPGDDYVGGTDLMPPDSPYVRVIPPADIPDRDAPFDAPPASLELALRQFFVGVACGLHRRDGRPPRRSMMIHPSRYVASHRVYGRWVGAICQLWTDILSDRLELEDKNELLAAFRDAWSDLKQTEPTLEDFEDLSPLLLNAMRSTIIRVVNSAAEVRGIDWHQNYSWILIGGQVLDRGFTIEGLTVTYMPRGRGVGHADTLQQRARFLGYKRPYLGFCRVFLEQDVRDAYWQYTRHEEDIRQRLAEFAEADRPLMEFRRIFILDPALEPTRRSVYDIDYQRLSLTHGWYSPQRAPGDEAVVKANRELVQRFLRRDDVHLEVLEGHPQRTPPQVHCLAAGLPLSVVYRHLLAEFQPGNESDDQRWLILLAGLSTLMSERQATTASVIQMSAGVARSRSVVGAGTIRNLFQGAYPVYEQGGLRQGEIYAGDRHIFTNDDVTVQLHTVTFYRGAIRDGELLVQEAPILVVRSRSEGVDDLIVQDQHVGRH